MRTIRIKCVHPKEEKKGTLVRRWKLDEALTSPGVYVSGSFRVLSARNATRKPSERPKDL